MDLLQEARAIINEADTQMAELFVKRMDAVQMVAQYKKEHDLPILDAAREEAVLRNGSARVEDETLREYYIDFLKDTMALSRRYQQHLLGSPEGEITVELGHRSYPIIIRRGALSHALLLSGAGDLAAAARYAAAALECTAEQGRPCGVCDACRKVAADIHPDESSA